MKRILLLVMVSGMVMICHAERMQNSHYALPKSIVDKVVQRAAESGWECEGDAKIVLSDLYSVESSKVMLLLGVPDYLCDTNSFLPVTVDREGNWKTGDFMEGRPELIFKRGEASIFMVTQWMVEGTYPALFHSANGTEWQMVPLPENRQVDCCFEWLSDICLEEGRMALTFTGDDGERTKHYSSPLQSVMNGAPVWRQEPGRAQTACPFSPSNRLEADTKVLEESGEILVKTRIGNRIVAFTLPKRVVLPPH